MATTHQGTLGGQGTPWWVEPTSGAPWTASFLYKYPKNIITLKASTKYSFSRRRVQNHQIQSRHHHGGIHHFHWCLSDDAWVVLCRPSGPYLVARWLPLSRWILNTMVSWISIWFNEFLRCVCWDLMNFEFMISYIFLYPWKLFEFLLISYMHDLL